MFSMPKITKNLLIVNVLMALATQVAYMRGIDLNNLLGLHFFMAPDFHVFQLLTYMFMHALILLNPTHILFNMFALWMFGSVIERVWGEKKFLFYYICCGIGAGLVQEVAQYCDYIGLFGQPVMNLGATVGASGCVYAILLAFGMTFPNERIFIFPLPIPIKAKWFVAGYAAIELYFAFSSSGDGVAHTAHLGGMLFGYLLIRYWNEHPGSQYNRSRGEEFFNRMKRNFEQHKGSGRTQQTPHMHADSGATKVDDMEYNARKKARQDEIDAILDKIRKSGYDSLTKEEKKRLFDASNER
jgi:membrane associated rhomboid family serine protease